MHHDVHGKRREAAASWAQIGRDKGAYSLDDQRARTENVTGFITCRKGQEVAVAVNIGRDKEQHILKDQMNLDNQDSRRVDDPSLMSKRTRKRQSVDSLG